MTDLEPASTTPVPGRGGRHRRRRGTSAPAPEARPGVQDVADLATSGTPAAGSPERSFAGPTVEVPGLRPDLPSAPVERAATGSAGRNLPVAIGVGVGLAVLVIVPLFTYRPAFVLVLAAAAGLGGWELIRAIQPIEARPPVVPLLVGGLATIVMAWAAGVEALLLGLLLTLVAVVVWRIPDGPVGFQRDVTAAALVAVYVPFLAGFAVLLVTPEDGAYRVIAFVATVVCSDVGGYVAGVLFGRHPMAPTVSPKKSWEGMAGSLSACAVAGVCFLVFFFDASWWQGVLFGIALAVAATLGDLAESMLKRDLGIKDMSTLLPGHGGLMDRLDSLLLAAPTAYLLLELFAPAA